MILVFLYTTFAKVALPVVAALLFLAFGRSNTQLETLAVIAAGILIGGVFLIFLLLRSEKTARRLGHAVGIAAQRVASWFRIRIRLHTPRPMPFPLEDRRFARMGFPVLAPT